MKLTAIALLLALTISCTPTSTILKAAKCGSAQVQKDWPKLLPRANDCLATVFPEGTPEERKFHAIRDCIDLAVQGVHTGIDTATCLIFDQRDSAAASVNANPGDVVSDRIHANASLWIEGTGASLE